MNGIPGHRVLIADDDETLCDLMAKFLRNAGFDVDTVFDGQSAIDYVKAENPELVVLDIMMPGQDGLSVCRAIRSNYQGKVIMFTALHDEIDEVAGLELGADDYIKKPVSPRLLLARIRMLLRRDSGNESSEPIIVGDLQIYPKKRLVLQRDEPLSLSTVEYNVLLLLVEHAGAIVSRDAIYDQLRRIEYDGVDRSIDLYISRLRKKLGDDPRQPRYIKTVRSAGYLFVDS